MKNAVVTGATGLLGAHLACRLHLKGYHVTCIEHASDRSLFETVARRFSLLASDFKWYRTSILNTDSLAEAFEGQDLVAHCAALVSYRKKDKFALYEANVLGTRNCCNVALKCGVKNFIYASSIAALGKIPKEKFIDEYTPWDDQAVVTEYSRTKYHAEMEVWRAAEEGLKVYIGNPGVIIGAGNGTGSSNQIFGQLKNGLKFYPSGGTGFVDVVDVADALIAMYEQDIHGKRMLLVSENLSYKEVLTSAAGYMHMKPPATRLGGVLLRTAYTIAYLCELLGIPFPFPSQGIRSTSAMVFYKSANIHLLKNFNYTPIEKSIGTAVKQLFGE